jgi:hypothetical protein
MPPLYRSLQPSTGQKYALPGTVGTPGTANRYVTEEDGRLNVTPDVTTRLVSGGGVTWISGYIFQVSPAVVVFNGETISCPETTITLDPADLTNDRIDLIVAQTSSTIDKVTGTASTPPASPEYDPTTQFQLAFVTVDAGSTQPGGVVLTTIYDEDVEWTKTVTGAGVVTNSVADPYHGAKNIEGTAVTSCTVKLTAGADFTLDGINDLILRIKPKAAWGTGYMQLSWLDSSGAGKRLGFYVTIRHGAYGFNSANAAYQTISIPIADFGNLTGVSNIRSLRMLLSSPAPGIGFYADLLQLQAGTSIVTPPVSIPEASETTKGIVLLAANGETTAGEVVQASDTRITAATTVKAGIATLAADGGTTASTVVQATDSRLAQATTIARGTVTLAADGGTTASTVVQANDSRLKLGCVMVLCMGFTPSGTGADSVELTVPYHPKDGTTSVTWNVRRITFRVGVAGGAPAARVEKSTATTAFSAATIGTATMGAGDYECNVTAALGTVASGNKIRLYVATLGTAQYWTVEVELGE